MSTISMRTAQLLVVLLFFFYLIAAALGWFLPHLFFLYCVLLAFGLWRGSTVLVPPPETGESDSHPERPRAYPCEETGRQLFLLSLVLAVATFLYLRTPRFALSSLLLRLKESRDLELTARLGTAWISVVWAGILIGLAVLVGAVLLAHWGYGRPTGSADDSSEGAVKRYGTAIRRAVSIILGLSQGTYVLDRGKLFSHGEQPVPYCAGPCFVEVHEGQAAVIETEGITTHAVHGRAWLTGKQRLTGWADLATQTAEVAVADACTSDGMLIQRFDLRVRYQIGAGMSDEEAQEWLRRAGQNDPKREDAIQKAIKESRQKDEENKRKSGQFSYNPRLLCSNMWKDTPETYKQGIVITTQNIVRGLINKHELQDIAILPDGRRKEIESLIRDELQWRMNAAGDWLSVKTVAIGHVQLHEQAQKDLMDVWTAEMQAAALKIRAAAEKETMILKGEGQAEAFFAVEKVKNEVRESLFKQYHDLKQLAPEKAEGYLVAIQSLIDYMAQDTTRAQQVVEALATMATHSKELNVYVTTAELLQQGANVGSQVPPGRARPAERP